MIPIRYLPEADVELEDAVRVYEQQREGRGAKFRRAVDKAEKDILRSPKGSPKHKRTKWRERLVPRFPYAIYYEEREDEILIVAVAHGKRRPGYWLKRAKNNPS